MAKENAALNLITHRQAGVCMHITSLPGSYGIGEIGSSARSFIDTLHAMRISVWQFLPLGPTAYGDSPYQPLSTFAGNEMLIDIGEFVARGLLQESEVVELTTLPENSVDYGALIPLKSKLLRLAARRFLENPPDDLRLAYEAFGEENNEAWLHCYALFRILKARHGERPWHEWEPQYARRDPGALRSLERTESDLIELIKVAQFFFHYQWQQLRDYAHDQGVTLFGDMPIYIALDSADAWATPEILRVDENGHPSHVAGVPPDYFSEDGQLWGNPLYDWDYHARHGYRWWIERLRATTKLVDIVRIDHFRGFEAYWAVPAGAATAREGTWEPGPNGAIFKALQEEFGTLPIVAEDLGVITPDVERLRDDYAMPGMHVLQFDVVDPDFRYEDMRRNSVCYTGTHDNDTTVGWFHGSPSDIRPADEIRRTQEAALELTGGTGETIHMDLVRAAFESNARLAIAPMQDFLGLGSEARINTPGTSANNWRWRVLDTQLTPELCDNIAEMVCASGRSPAN
jgi:4-alpha-glucanotransferase